MYVYSGHKYVNERQHMQAKTERFEMRLDQETLERVDAWGEKQPDNPSRAEAIRRLVDAGLWTPSEPEPRVRISDGERLMLHMMCDLFQHLDVESEIDPKFVEEALYHGENWALRWKYPGIFHGYETERRVLSETVNILEMWSFLESGYQSLSKKDMERVEKEADPLGTDVKFPGFDGNNETEHMGVAEFLIEKMERFETFKGRRLNAHMPTLEMHRRMLPVFQPMRTTLMGGELNAGQIIELLQERIHPERRK